MPKFNIPSSYIPGIKEISLLLDSEFAHLLEDLRKADSENSKEDLQALIEVYLDSQRAEEIASSIFSFGYLLIREPGGTEEIAADLTESFIDFLKNEEEDANLAVFLENQHKTQERLTDILVLSDFLLPQYEAFRGVYEGNRVLKNSDVSTDILIINDRNYKNKATGVILNKLRFETMRDEQRSLHVITLDKADLLILKKQVDRALKDSEEMQSSYKDFINFIQI